MKINVQLRCLSVFHTQTWISRPYLVLNWAPLMKVSYSLPLKTKSNGRSHLYENEMPALPSVLYLLRLCAMKNNRNLYVSKPFNK